MMAETKQKPVSIDRDDLLTEINRRLKEYDDLIRCHPQTSTGALIIKTASGELTKLFEYYSNWGSSASEVQLFKRRHH